MAIYSLNIHADYACRHTGVCCSAGWDVPVELPVCRNLKEALDGGHLRAAAPGGHPPFIVKPALPQGAAAMLARTSRGECVFLERESRLCVVHRDLGESALPSACRHFPRLALRDRRGTFITLSHFCPTAASMLFRGGMPLEIVEAPAAFPPGDYEGLSVAAGAWPPLLHARMLMDLVGYGAWERHMVRRCATESHAPESVVTTLARDAERLCRWTSADGPLEAAVASLPCEIADAAVAHTLEESLRARRQVMDTVPHDLRPVADEEELADTYVGRVLLAWRELAAPVNRFLAAKAFASWIAYQGRGVQSIVRGLESALAIVRVEAARQCRDAGRALDAELLSRAFQRADLLLTHLADRQELARQWSRDANG